MTALGQALLFILVASILPFGGIIEDPAAGPADPIVEAMPAEADVTRDGATVDAQAPTDGAGVQAGASASVDEAGASIQAAHASLQASQERVVLTTADQLADLPVEIPLLPPSEGVTVEIDLDPSEDGSSSATVSMQSLVVAPPGPPASDLPDEDLLTRAASATAFAAIAAAQVAPAPRGIKRFLPLFPLYSRISRDEVLDHETRAGIYSLLKEDPGLSLQEISERLELSRSTARHHLRVLEDAEMVGHESRGRCRVHFPIGRRREALREHLLANETRARILELVKSEPHSLVELARALDANPGAVDFHLKKLVDAGILERYENGSITYRPGTTFRPV